MSLPRCGKRQYRDKKQALDAAHRRLNPNKPEAAEYLRVYECWLCEGRPWHLTSQRPRYATATG